MLPPSLMVISFGLSERMRLRIYAAELGHLRRACLGVTRMRGSVTREELKVVPLLIRLREVSAETLSRPPCMIEALFGLYTGIAVYEKIISE